jgi:hypothetical protein
VSHALLTACAALCLSAGSIAAVELPSQDSLMLSAFTSGVVVDLRDPRYEDGVVWTDQGGVLTTDEIRIQAQHIRYEQGFEDGKEYSRMEAEENILVEYGSQSFTAERITYDFMEREGTLWTGRTGIKRWYIGGERFDLFSDRSYSVRDAYITSCENVDAEWAIRSSYVKVLANGILQATGTQFRFIQIPLLWVPSFATDLDTIARAPLKYDLQWGGHQGPRFTVRYQSHQSEYWSTWLRLDYRIQRGLGGGIEAYYSHPERDEQFTSLNYVAKDESAVDPRLSTRYMFKGCYFRQVDPCTTVDLNYEKLSDEDMATDYYDKDFEFRNAGRSDLAIHRQTNNTTTYALTRVRLNSFQNIKEELPSIDFSTHPYAVPALGLMLDNRFRAGYYSFKYADSIQDTHDYSSLRLEARSRLYRPFCFGHLAVTPELEGIGIAYSKSPQLNNNEKYINILHAGVDARTSFFALYPCLKHVITPYSRYHYYSSPGVAVENHYVFDIDDGWEKLNMLTFGVENSLYGQRCEEAYRHLSLDVYADHFWNSDALRRSIPRAYADLRWNPFSTLSYKAKLAWDIERDSLSNLALGMDFTGSRDFALSTELLFRDEYYWRKLDRRHMILDAARSESELRQSSLSDKRATLLGHAFWRFAPQSALELRTRYGYARTTEPSYFEYQIDLHSTWRCAWRVRFSYQHKEHDDRFTVYINLLKKAPTHCYYRPPTWG